MSRKDFERIAAAIRDLDLSRYGDQAYQQRKYIAAAIATAIAPTNPLFDRDRFITAATTERSLP